MTEEIGWLIERSTPMGPGWYACSPHTKWELHQAVDVYLWRENWTREASNALRFALKVDAETLIRFEGLQNAIATEHKWCGK